MIKGAQKKMIVMKTADSELFEEAYFVLRRESRAGDEDMVREANRIIETGGGGRRTKEGSRFKDIILAAVGFLSGLLAGSGIVVLVFFL